MMNRWHYKSGKYVSQYGVRYLNEDRTGGQLNHDSHGEISDPYRIHLQTNRLELFTKQAYMMNPEKAENVALILSGSYHEQLSDYDQTPYNVYQKNLYASLMYEKEFSKGIVLVQD